MPRANGQRRDTVLRRQAIQIVALLPDDLADALAILDYARTLMCEFVGEPPAGDADDSDANILAFKSALALIPSRA
jgi:hypothetical protein